MPRSPFLRSTATAEGGEERGLTSAHSNIFGDTANAILDRLVHSTHGIHPKMGSLSEFWI
jgi:hypothetical protein